MFNILHDSIFNPKGLIKQIKRSGWFTFLYILIMAVFMSLGVYNAYFSYHNIPITEQSSGCVVTDGTLVCDGSNYNVNDRHLIYDIPVFFMSADKTIEDISEMGDVSIVIQGSSLMFYRAKTLVISQQIIGIQTPNITTLSDLTGFITKLLLISGIISNTFRNLVLVLAIILFSSIMFYRYRFDIKFGKRFKLVTYGLTPVILLFTFYNLIVYSFNIGNTLIFEIVFFAIAFFAYRPLFIMNRELGIEIAKRKMQKMQDLMKDETEESDDVIDSIEHDDVSYHDIKDDEDDTSDED